jgi:hypothetical protein
MLTTRTRHAVMIPWLSASVTHDRFSAVHYRVLTSFSELTTPLDPSPLLVFEPNPVILCLLLTALLSEPSPAPTTSMRRFLRGSSSPRLSFAAHRRRCRPGTTASVQSCVLLWQCTVQHAQTVHNNLRYTQHSVSLLILFEHDVASLTEQTKFGTDLNSTFSPRRLQLLQRSIIFHEIHAVPAQSGDAEVCSCVRPMPPGEFVGSVVGFDPSALTADAAPLRCNSTFNSICFL